MRIARDRAISPTRKHTLFRIRIPNQCFQNTKVNQGLPREFLNVAKYMWDEGRVVRIRMIVRIERIEHIGFVRRIDRMGHIERI